MPNCKLVKRESKIVAYVTGELSPAEMQDFQNHLLNCDTCFQEVERQVELVATLRENGDELFAAVTHKRNPALQNQAAGILDRVRQGLHSESRWLQLGVAFAAIALMIYLGQRLMAPGTIQPDLTHDTTPKLQVSPDSSEEDSSAIVREETALPPEGDSLPAPIELDPRQLYAANFEPSPILEEMVGDVSRSYSLEIKSPANGRVYKDEDITFEWRATDVKVSALKILDNRGNDLLSLSPLQNQQLRLTEDLEPGLYYWKLESTADLLHIGKFYVEKLPE